MAAASASEDFPCASYIAARTQRMPGMPCWKVTCCSASRQHQCCCIAPNFTVLCTMLTLLQTGAVMLQHSFPTVEAPPGLRNETPSTACGSVHCNSLTRGDAEAALTICAAMESSESRDAASACRGSGALAMWLAEICAMEPDRCRNACAIPARPTYSDPPEKP